MKEYSIDEIKEQKDKEGPEYKTVGSYTINIILNKEKIVCSIDTLVSKSGELVWVLSDGESIHPQDVKLESIKNNNKSKKIMYKMIQDVYLEQTKDDKFELKSILEKNKGLAERMLTDYIKFDYKKKFKK